jgi:hypothetical protein
MGGEMTIILDNDEHARLLAQAARADELQALIDTPELVDFPKAVHLEAVHQVVRCGTADREGKGPYEWFWLLSHLATRALEHHKEAERLSAVSGAQQCDEAHSSAIAHHRNKAVHHVITSAAVMSHWHASILGRATNMRPGAPSPPEVTHEPEADLSLHRQALDLADRFMWSVLDVETEAQDELSTVLGFIDRDGNRATSLLAMHQDVQDAVQWLQQRGYVEVLKDESGEFVNVLRRLREEG